MTPVSVAPTVQALYPYVTEKQAHVAWTEMSVVLWKKDKMQLPSMEMLLQEDREDVDVFNIEIADSIGQLCWGMKKIRGGL